MSVRVWISSPVVSNGVNVAKAEQYCTGGHVNFFPTNLDGTPASTWVLTVGRAAAWTTADLDLDLKDLFEGDVPSNTDTVAALKAYLRVRLLGDVPLGPRLAILATLDSRGVLHADLGITTPLWKFFQRTVSTLMEKDANFAAGFNF